jgi:hypothetical protein
MTLRRALVTAPLAVLVALAAHAIGFGGQHALGGAHAGMLLAAGLGGTLLLAGAALVWLVLTQSNARAGERVLLALLPAGGGLVAATAVLGLSGFAAFACGEALEGHFPLGTLGTALASFAVSALIALGSRRSARWLADGAAALATLLAWPLGARACLAVTIGPAPRPTASQLLARGRHDGRAPPNPA